MNIDATLVGQLIFVLAIVMAVVGFYLGKRKTQTPFLVSVLGFVSALVPPFGSHFPHRSCTKKRCSTNI